MWQHLALKVPRNAKTSRFDMTDKVLLRTDNVVIHCKCEGIMQKMEFQTLISPIHPKMLKTARLGLWRHFVITKKPKCYTFMHTVIEFQWRATAYQLANCQNQTGALFKSIIRHVSVTNYELIWDFLWSELSMVKDPFVSTSRFYASRRLCDNKVTSRCEWQ